MDAKPVTKSWTVWVNVLSFLVVMLQMAGTVNLGSLLFHDPAQAGNLNELFTALLAVVNVLLRFKTNQAVALKLT